MLMNFFGVRILLHADDVIVVGDQSNRVQKILNMPPIFCRECELQVNMAKIKARSFVMEE